MIDGSSNMFNGSCDMSHRLCDARAYVFDDHDQEGKLDGEGFLRVNGAGDVVG